MSEKKKEFGEGISVKPEVLQKHHLHMAGRNKFQAQKTMYNGVMYDSKIEAAYAARLDVLRKASGADKVVDVERQKKFSFDHGGVHICSLIIDFVVKYADGRTEYHEVKGFETRESSIKRKLAKAFYGLEIKVIKQV
jgi:hypothetical protein